MKGKLIKKLCAAAMSILMLAGAGAINALPFVGMGVTVSAEELLAAAEKQLGTMENVC